MATIVQRTHSEGACNSFQTFLEISILLALLAVTLTAAARAETPEAFKDLEALHAEIETIHLRASVEVSIRQPLFEGQGVPLHGFGSFEHWEKAGMFRSQTWIDPHLGLMDNLEFAFDGSSYQILNPDQGSLAIEEPQFLMGDLQMVPTAVPNPFYLLTKFLAPSDDACPGCLPGLQHLQAESTWAEKFSTMGPVVTDDTKRSFQMSGGMRMGEAYSFRVTAPKALATASTMKAIPLERIDRLDALGRRTESIQFSEPMEIQGLSGDYSVPGRITVYSIDPSLPEADHVTAVIDYTLELFEANADLDDAVFSLPRQDVTSLWVKGELVAER